MKAVIVNTVAKEKSTGKIAYGLFRHLKNKDINTVLVYGQGKKYNEPGLLYIGSFIASKIHILFSRLLGFPGFFSFIPTLFIILKLRTFRPDFIVLFNIHGYFLNEYLFLWFLGRYGRPVVYVMLDEYPALGKCGFSMGCYKYIEACKGCESIDKYPASWFFNTSYNIAKIKKRAYSKMGKLTFVACEYTKSIAEQAAITRNERIVSADEAIDLAFYYPRDSEALRGKLEIPMNNKVVVCIAVYPNERKGGQYFIQMSKLFSEEDNVTFVHVGYSGNREDLPGYFITIPYIEDQETLCQFYSLGDILCFPSLCETIPSTCVESIACGTPIMVFDISGMPYIGDETCSYVVPPKDIMKMSETIRECPRKTQDVISRCRDYAEKRYDNRVYFDKILETATQLL